MPASLFPNVALRDTERAGDPSAVEALTEAWETTSFSPQPPASMGQAFEPSEL
jgi:hypothetical protein